MIQTIKSCCSLWCKRGIPLVVLLGLLSGCAATTPVTDTNLRIGVVVYDQSDTFISTVIQHMEADAQQKEQEHNIKITLSFQDSRSNQTVQLEQVNQFIAQDYDVICVNIVDRTAAAVLIDKAEEANIPLILFNRQPVDEDVERWSQVYYIGADGAESGQLQGEIVRELWLDDQSRVDKNGDGILQYVMLEGEQGHQDALLRTQYSIGALTTGGVRVEKLAGDTASWSRGQAADKMLQWLNELDTTVEVVFANNDDMALGAIDTYLDKGYAVDNLPVVVGVDAIPAALEALEAGTLAGTVLNDSEGMSQSMLTLSIALWQGTDPGQVVELVDEHYVWLQYQKITKDNG